MLQDSDFDSDVLLDRTLLFWAVPGPRTGTAVVVATRPSEIVTWLTDRATVEGPGSPLARALPVLRARLHVEPDDRELVADALAAALEEAGITVFAFGPLARELADHETLRRRVFADLPEEGESPRPDAVWRGGESHAENEGHAATVDADDAPEQGYKLDEEIEEWAEHEEGLSLDRAAVREFVASRLETLRTARPDRRVA